MDEEHIRRLIGDVKRGRMARRRFVQLMVGAGLTVPMAGVMLMNAGVASAAERVYKPARRGGGGLLKLLMWQGPTLLNPHFATGTKDIYGARLFYQSLAEWDSDGNLIPILAAEIPTLDNGGIARDGRSVVWKLKPQVRWHDGAPFTADDLVFNQEYAADLATAAVTWSVYRDVGVEKLAPHTVRLVFQKPTPNWAEAFVGVRGLIIPKHVFDPYRGGKSRDAPANLKPVGTGAYRFASFQPGDMVRAVANPDYHEPHRPHFDAVEMKGGGDAVSAARAVLQTGEFDYAWNVLVEDEILRRLEQGGKGRIAITPGGGMEHIQLNCADPWKEVDGERASARSRHPVFSERAVREAFALLVDRPSIQAHVFGRTGIATGNYLYNPQRYRSPNTRMEFDVAKANRILDGAGWKPGADGIRAKDGRRMKFEFRTSTNAPRQKVQAIVKQACRKAGMDLELRSIPASVFFSGDAGNNDTSNKFFSDIQMYAFGGNVDPELFMRNWCSWEIPTRENKWGKQNAPRWQNAEYDGLFRSAQSELDPVRRAALFIRMNDVLVEDRHVIPLVNRPGVAALSKTIRAQLSSWASDIFLIQDWYRDA